MSILAGSEGSWLDPAAYDDRDLSRTLLVLPGLFEQLLSTDGRGLEAVEVPDTVRESVGVALRSLDRRALSSSFTEACTMLASLVSVDGFRAAADDVLASSLAEWTSIAKRMRALRSETVTGAVAGLHSSKGGVPKRSVMTASVGLRGLDGDRQATRLHHGRPWQALCLWSAETIAGLQAEGHPIAAGLAGENILTSGIEWAEAKPGTLLRIGSMIAEITIAALPCKKNAGWFLDGNFNRMHHEREAGVSRMYASVLEPGTITHGDTVTLELR
jgi:MOSC domain-containing protein YiiM